MENEQTVSLQGLLKWALEERLEREIAGRPAPELLEELYPDTSAFRRRVFEGIERAQKEAIRPRRLSLRAMKKVLLAAAILISLLACTLMTSAAVRSAVVNTIIDWTDRDMGIRFIVEGEPLTRLPEGYGPHVIPERFHYREDWSYVDESCPNFAAYGYASEDGADVLDISILIAGNSSIYRMDNEHTEFERITFQGVTAYLGHGFSANGQSEIYKMLWVKDGMEHYIYGTVSLSELFEIAENIY